MRRITSILACTLIMSSSLQVAQAASTQQTVSFQVNGQKVVGTLQLPTGVKKPPVILMLHGFTGSRNELSTPAVKEGIFTHAAGVWADKGYASLRIDFRGSGESEGQFEDTTLSNQIVDALAAVTYLQSVPTVNAKKLAVLGWSQGGAVATAVAGRSTYPIKAVGLWAPVSEPIQTFPELLGHDLVKKGLASGGQAVSTTLPWGASVSLKTAFFEDLYRIAPVAELAQYKGAVFVAVGTKDTVVTPQPALGKTLLAYHKGASELWVRPMDHSFNAFENADTLNEMIDATGAFLTKHLQGSNLK